MKIVKPNVVPPFRVHKGTGQGYVILDGRRVYLGRADLPEAKQRYARAVAESMPPLRRTTARGAMASAWTSGLKGFRAAVRSSADAGPGVAGTPSVAGGFLRRSVLPTMRRGPRAR